MLKPRERHRPLICWPLLQWEAKVIDIRDCTDSDLDNSVRNKALTVKTTLDESTPTASPEPPTGSCFQS